MLCAPVRRVVFKQRVQRARDRADRAVADGVARERRDGDDVRVAREEQPALTAVAAPRNCKAEYEPRRGDLVAWRGWDEHRILPVTRGTRRILVGFVGVDMTPAAARELHRWDLRVWEELQGEVDDATALEKHWQAVISKAGEGAS